MLRNVQWMVTKQRFSEALFSRPVLEIIGMVARDVIAHAADRIGGEADVGELGPGENSESRVSRILIPVVHSHRGVDEQDVDTEDWCYFGEDLEEEKTRGKESELSDAKGKEISEYGNDKLSDMLAKEISEYGKDKLSDMLVEFGDVLRLRLGRGPPAKVEPMEI